MTNTNGYKFLGPKRGSMYRQFFVKGRNVRAEVIFHEMVGPEQLTPEEVAENWNLPLEVVLECIAYCEENADLLRQEWEEEEASLARNRALYPANYPLPPKS
jgi:uncharacterized protein (DUF433 family)